MSYYGLGGGVHPFPPKGGGGGSLTEKQKKSSIAESIVRIVREAPDDDRAQTRVEIYLVGILTAKIAELLK